MISISEKLGKLKKSVKESIEKEKLLRGKEALEYKNAKAAELKNQEAIRKAKELEKEADRLKAAREKGIKAALPGAKKEAAKSIVRGGLAFLKAHVKTIPERRARTPRKKKMSHKKRKAKRGSATSKRYM